MSALIRKIGLIFTALLLVAATGGYSIYRHYCDCHDTATTSIFLEMECDHNITVAEAPSCCSLEERACCTSDNHSNDDHQCHSEDCCQTNSEFLKIDDSYTSSQDKASFKIFFTALKLYENELLFSETFSEPANYFFSDSSPPITGRQRLLEFHQLKLSPELG
jgi:hypothetical protein